MGAYSGVGSYLSSSGSEVGAYSGGLVVHEGGKYSMKVATGIQLVSRVCEVL